jgi:hypothetical protein
VAPPLRGIRAGLLAGVEKSDEIAHCAETEKVANAGPPVAFRDAHSTRGRVSYDIPVPSEVPGPGRDTAACEMRGCCKGVKLPSARTLLDLLYTVEPPQPSARPPHMALP